MNKILVKSKTMSKKGKNMKKKILLPIIGLLSFAALAAGESGHVYEVRPWDYDNGHILPNGQSSIDSPMPGNGQDKFYFIVRLLNSNWMQPLSTVNWDLPSPKLGSFDVHWTAHRPKIGIVVSGRTVGAQVEDVVPDSTFNGTLGAYYTDIICSYEIKSGDFALPVCLAADNNGTPISAAGASQLYIVNGDYWNWKNVNGADDVIFEYPTSIPSGYSKDPEGETRQMDDMSKCGFYVKTIDFTGREDKSTWYSDTVWRGVHEYPDETSAEPDMASITVDTSLVAGQSTLGMKLYVWSDDPDVIDLPDGTDTTVYYPASNGDYDPTNTKEQKVYAINISSVNSSFTIKAIGANGAATKLYLSQYKGFTYTGNRLNEDYLTVPVAVIEKKKPSVKVQYTTTDRFTVSANPDAWVTPVGTVRLMISGGYATIADTLTVTLTPSITDGTLGWSNYVHIASDSTSSTQDGPLVFTYDKNLTSTNDRKFANGEEIIETVYVYGLGADSHTSVGGVMITPTLDDAAAASNYFQPPTALNVYFDAEQPTLSVVNVEADGNFKRKFDIKVSDNHKNTIDGSGYTVSYWSTNTVTGAVSDPATLKGKWKLDGNRVLVSVDDATKKPEISYSAGRYVTVFRVTTPAGDVYSTTCNTTVNVAEPARASAVIVLEDNTTVDTGKYDENDDTVISVKVKLSSAYPDANVWAFLAPVAGSGTAERSAGNIITNAATTIGMLIPQGELESDIGGLQVVDGKGGTGSTLSYDVVLCTESQFDPNKLVEGYQSKTLRITASNVAPAISDVMLNGIGTAEFDNHYFTQLIPVGRTNSIKPNITDVAADIKGNMVITLNARCETGDIMTPVTITNTTEAMTAEFKNVVFNTEGKWTVKIKATDKDGGVSNEYSFSFNVKEPNIGIGNESNYFEDYYENDTGAVLPISLSFFDTATNQIVVKVTVKAPSGTNPGRFVLADTYRKDIEGYPALAENEYYVPFKTAKTENLRIVDMDGTDRSSDAGFEIKAEVVTEGLNTAYSNVSKVAYVRNVSPEFSDSVIPQNTETNAFPVGRELTLSVATKYEAKSDLTNQWTAVDLAGASVTTNGVRIAISGCVNADVFFIADAGSYKFRPEFDNSSYGVQTVMMTIEDKDGGSGEALVYYFEVPLSKALVTAANGPGSGTTSIPLSSRYARQKGVGEGHVYVSDANFEKAENFALKWNCARSSTVTAYAFGYVDGALDDGTLDVVDGKAYDIAINAYGNRAQGSGNPAEPYEYSDVRNRDSYFYGWIQSTEPDGNEYTIAVNPEVGNKRYATTRIDLPSEANKDGAGYAETYAEAVFSKEYKESDNMGDINEDGVPDYFAILDYANGRLAEPDGQGSELGAVNALNDDEDYLPGGSQITGANFIPGDTSGWSTRGAPFTARMEIRGFGGADESEGANSTVYGGLNYGMFKFGDELKHGWISDLDLTQNEKISLLKHVFARRDAILNRRYTQRPRVNKFDDDDWIAVTNLLATLIRSDTSYYENGSDPRKAYIPGFPEGPLPNTYWDNPETYISDTWSEGLGHKTLVFVTNIVNAVASQPELYPAVTNVTTNVCWVSEMYSTSGLVPRSITNTVEIVTNIYTEGATVKTNLFWRTPYDRITIDDINVNEWLDRKASGAAFNTAQAAAKEYIDHIWSHYLNRDTSEWGWTCENRTDPTIDDTDGDGFSDGYEYYIWYSAVVGFNGNTLSGYKIDLSDRDSRGIPITSAEIASLYNPNVEGSIKRDTDEDGIADFEEMVIGTNPFHWDTDGDGLSDGYELTYNMDPLSASGEHGCDMNLDGDFMAFVDVADNNTREELAHLLKYKYIYTATNGTVWAFSTNVVDQIRYIAQRYPTQKVFELRNVTAFKVGKYGVTKYTDKEGVTKYYDDYYIPATEELDKLLVFLDPSSTSYELDAVWTNASTFVINPQAGSVTLRDEKRANDPEPPAVAMGLFHHQVHNAFGFDPRTGWYSSGNGLSKTARWKNGLNAVVPGGAAQNTTAFKARYEYTLPKYLSIVNSDMAWVPTNPGVPYEATSETEDGEVEHHMTQHGADTDADGVPDGWELYIGVDPGTAFTSDDETTYNRIRDIDKVDGLTLAYEFAGTDSCGVYSECASIYKNHPSQDTGTMKNWYNKFFPTNPRESDTDGDSISDGAEGKSWRGEFVINRIPQTEDGSVSINYFSIYGSPSDDGTTSIRGGGYNPCTIDTDSDGLPDPWERQFTGVLFNGTEISDSEDYDVFYASAAGQIDERVRKDIKAAIVAYDIPTNVLAGAEFYHILMGMDGTVADASTSTLLGASDLDWDGDGLQNWQEYLVQAMRLFRYDDDKTPLLGLDCPSVAADGEKQGKWNVDNGFLQISYTEPFTDVQLEFIDEELGYHNFAVWAQRTENYMKDLGYFIDPPMAWDHARNTLKQKYMLPPANIRYYTFAKGLSQATDGNGNAIYTYELAGKLYEFTNNVSGVVNSSGNALVGGKLRKLTAKMVDNSALAMDAYTVSPGKYFTTDPRRWDTDADGMDDYYELFHGLNPILGEVAREAGMNGKYVRGKDVIATATAGKVSPGNNAWIGWSNEEAPVYDPIRYPWLMGAGECDADSDGLRNSEESLLANATSPNAMHTDPTPLWMTDVSVKTRTSKIFRTTTTPVMEDDGYGNQVQLWDYNSETGEEYPVYETITVNTDQTVKFVDTPSYAALFYRNELKGTGVNNVSEMSALPYGGWHLSSSDYAFSFEQNEGYDTDNDWRSDSAELQNSAEPTSDPLNFADPQRRQSVWFGGPGDEGMLVSREESKRSTGGVDLFKQFTVEAWVRPENPVSGKEQYIVSRAVYCNASSVINTNAQVRLDFALGINTNGCAFGELMNSVDAEYRKIGTEIPQDEWTHLAATFDGYNFSLYMNGELVDSGVTTLISANGTTAILQNPHFSRMEGGAYSQDPSIMAVGARPVGETIFNVANVSSATGWSDIATDFFKGSVDEVRCWDGARTADEIKADYRTRYTPERAKENRIAVYNAYVNGASRNDTAGRSTLPPELIHHYDFSTLAGAHDAAYVQKVPAGFGSRLLASVCRPDDGTPMDSNLVKVGWWSGVVGNADIGSKVYTSPNVVPWVEDTVAHLPKLCGSVADSVFWSENFAGYVAAEDNGLSTYSFPNTMNPYTVVEELNEYSYLRAKLAKVSNTTNETANAYPELSLMTNGTVFARFYYDNRRGFSGNSDLIPLGSAFAKRLTEYWDGEGPEDAWAITTNGTVPDGDPDCDGIPVWAAAYKDVATYKADLAKGRLPTGFDDTFSRDYYFTELSKAGDVDENENGIADWWETYFGIYGCEADCDEDNDGLSNYQEFLISFGDYSTVTTHTDSWSFTNRTSRNIGMPFLDPTNPRSTGEAVTDYFLKPDFSQLIGNSHITENTYLGEMATDHDFMEMWWERENDLRDSNLTAYYSNPFVYDPHLDLDGDGWSNFAEARAYSWHGGFIADLIDSYLLKRDEDHILHYPQPAIGVNVTYNGKGDYTSKTLVVRARTKADGRVDATLVAEGYEQTNDSNDGGEGSQLIGIYPGATTLHGFMNPGYIIPSTSVTFDFRPVVSETLYHWHCTECSAKGVTLYAIYNAHVLLHEKANEETGELGVVLDRTSVANDYERFAHSEPLANARTGRVLLETANSTNKVYIGTVNYITGEYSLDLAKAAENGCDLKDTVLRVSWTFQRGQIWPQTVWLSQPISTYATGLIKEGKNIIEAFIDLNLNNLWDEGEPYGMVKDVEIGWHKTGEAIDIELRDYSPIMKRTPVTFGSTDNSQASFTTAKVAVRRTAINGVSDGLPVRTLCSTTVISDDRAYITEADVITAARPDLDWAWLAKDAERKGVTVNNATYDIVRIDTLDDGTKTNTVLATFTRDFHSKRAVPTVLAPIQSALVYAARPTFTFRCDDETMTAYCLQVATNNTDGVIWNSGTNALPGRLSYTIEDGATYRVSPELYVDTFATTNGTAVLVDGANYYWRVGLMNAKFNSVDKEEDEKNKIWSEWAPFQMDVRNNNPNPDVQTGYGNIAAAVRYYGAGTVTDTTTGTTNIIVEAYASADFTGIPLARMRVENLDLLSSATDVTTTNVTLRGLPPGEIFLVAFVDANNNCRRDKFESWGYANYVGEDTKFIYKPRAVEVTNITSQFPSISIFIEDTDLNQNELVDILEIADIAGAEEENRDTDKDGLKDMEEDDYFASASMWDTDGDGMPDGWEALYAKLDPTLADADYALDGDVMAYAEVVRTVVTFDDDSGPYIVAGGAAPRVGDDAFDYSYFETYYYGDKLGLGGAYTAPDGAKIKSVETRTVALVHAQVYDEFGFNPMTANASVPEDQRVNTKPFTALDKYLVVRYLEALGLANEANVNKGKNWSRYTLKPGETDYDRDGMPDGWELYTMFGPTGAGTEVSISPWDKTDRASDPDGDGLENVDEFDNGFNPSDPWNGDSNGDGIGDKAAIDYGFKTGDDAEGRSGYRGDADNDQLSNFMEYLISGLEGFPEIDPEANLDASAMSTFAESKNQLVPDYFLPHGKLYLGEMFADHDMIEDWWEDEQPVEVNIGGARVANYSRYSFDAASDTDGDGWSNWAEARMAIAGGKVAVTTVTTNTVGGVTTVETNTVEKYVYDQNGAITPTIQAVFRYNGDKTGVSSTDTLVVKAWTTARATLGECDAAWVLPVGNLATDGSISVTLEKPTYGTLREGSNMFEAYIVDGTVESVTDYTVGKPYGVATDVTVNYLRGEPFTLELTNIDPTTMRVDLAKAIDVQREYAATLATRDSEWWTRYNSGNSEARTWYNTQISEAFNRMATESTDRSTVKAGYATLYCPKYGGTNLTFAVSNTVHVWLTQMLVNRQLPARYYKTEIFDKEMDLGRRSVLTEADLLASGEYDLGWNTLRDSVESDMLASVTSAVFGVVIDAAPSSYLAENNLLLVEIENHYEKGQMQSAAKCLSATVTAGQPTFEWRHDNTIGKPYPAFRLKVWAKEGNNKLVYDSYVQRAPARNASGVYRWTAPLWVGSMTTQGEVFEADKDYVWSVSMLDAKFQDSWPANGICKGEFHITDSADAAGLSDYGSIAVAVKYMGPGSVKVSGKTGIIRVEAYELPDFSGMPVAASYVLNKNTLSSVDKIAMNALLKGLPKGNAYYVLAYLDSNGDGKRQTWESWGYGCWVGDPERRDVYTPRAYGVALTHADDLNTPTCVIYLEDCDTNNNKLPDVLELKDNNFSPSSSPTAESPYIVTVSATGAKGALNVFDAVEPDVVSLPYYSTLVEMENGGAISSPSLALAMSGVSVASLNVEPKVTIVSFSSAEGVTIEVDPRAVVDDSTLVTTAVDISIKLRFTFEWTPNLATDWIVLDQTTGEMSLTGKTTFAADDPVLSSVNEEIKAISEANPTAFFRLKSVEVVPNN